MIWANKSVDIGINKLDARVHRFPSRSNFALLKETLDHGSGSLFKLKDASRQVSSRMIIWRATAIWGVEDAQHSSGLPTTRPLLHRLSFPSPVHEEPFPGRNLNGRENDSLC